MVEKHGNVSQRNFSQSFRALDRPSTDGTAVLPCTSHVACPGLVSRSRSCCSRALAWSRRVCCTRTLSSSSARLWMICSRTRSRCVTRNRRSNEIVHSRAVSRSLMRGASPFAGQGPHLPGREGASSHSSDHGRRQESDRNLRGRGRVRFFALLSTLALTVCACRSRKEEFAAISGENVFTAFYGEWRCRKTCFA
jgi:hypothetical protein